MGLAHAVDKSNRLHDFLPENRSIFVPADTTGLS
jgi:hypothetical protein